MDEEVVIDLFNRAKGLGYSKSIDDFKLLLSTDNQVIDDNFQYVKSQGYGKSIEDFKILIGASPQVATETIEDPLKKKKIRYKRSKKIRYLYRRMVHWYHKMLDKYSIEHMVKTLH